MSAFRSIQGTLKANFQQRNRKGITINPLRRTDFLGGKPTLLSSLKSFSFFHKRGKKIQQTVEQQLDHMKRSLGRQDLEIETNAFKKKKNFRNENKNAVSTLRFSAPFPRFPQPSQGTNANPDLDAWIPRIMECLSSSFNFHLVDFEVISSRALPRWWILQFRLQKLRVRKNPTGFLL
jgi:hypothetical protein